jgi:competence protein ComEC
VAPRSSPPATLRAVMAPLPDVLIAADGEATAVRGTDGKLLILHAGRDTFAIKAWLMADGDERTPKDESLKTGGSCDEIGCIGRLQDGRLVSFALAAEAFAEDCTRANGAMALRWPNDHFEQSAAHPNGYERPWARSPTERATAPVRRPQDVTPKTEDLEPDDRRLVAPKQPHQLALDAHAVRRENSYLVSRIGRLKRNRSAAAAEAL